MGRERRRQHFANLKQAKVEAALKRDPKDAQAMCQLGGLLAAQGKFRKALQPLMGALEAEEKGDELRWRVLMLLGCCLYEEAAVEEAAIAFRKALWLEKRMGKLPERNVQLRLSISAYMSRVFAQSKDIDCSYKICTFYFSRVYKRDSPGQSGDELCRFGGRGAMHIFAASICRAQQNYTGALYQYEAAHREGRRSLAPYTASDVWLMVCLTYGEMGQTKLQDLAFEYAQTGSNECWTQLAAKHEYQHDFYGALECLDKALIRQPCNSYLLDAQVRCLAGECVYIEQERQIKIKKLKTLARKARRRVSLNEGANASSSSSSSSASSRDEICTPKAMYLFSRARFEASQKTSKRKKRIVRKLSVLKRRSTRDSILLKSGQALNKKWMSQPPKQLKSFKTNSKSSMTVAAISQSPFIKVKHKSSVNLQQMQATTLTKIKLAPVERESATSLVIADAEVKHVENGFKKKQEEDDDDCDEELEKQAEEKYYSSEESEIGEEIVQELMEEHENRKEEEKEDDDDDDDDYEEEEEEEDYSSDDDDDDDDDDRKEKEIEKLIGQADDDDDDDHAQEEEEEEVDDKVIGQADDYGGEENGRADNISLESQEEDSNRPSSSTQADIEARLKRHRATVVESVPVLVAMARESDGLISGILSPDSDSENEMDDFGGFDIDGSQPRLSNATNVDKPPLFRPPMNHLRRGTEEVFFEMPLILKEDASPSFDFSSIGIDSEINGREMVEEEEIISLGVTESAAVQERDGVLDSSVSDSSLDNSKSVVTVGQLLKYTDEGDSVSEFEISDDDDSQGDEERLNDILASPVSPLSPENPF